jgi:guanylate kinase
LRALKELDKERNTSSPEDLEDDIHKMRKTCEFWREWIYVVVNYSLF